MQKRVIVIDLEEQIFDPKSSERAYSFRFHLHPKAEFVGIQHLPGVTGRPRPYAIFLEPVRPPQDREDREFIVHGTTESFWDENVIYRGTFSAKEELLHLLERRRRL